jgi:hypothetical protein
MSLQIVAQIYIAISIFVVWVLRYQIVDQDFKDFGYPDILKRLVGFMKTSIATLLICGIWYPSLVTLSALAMALLMLVAQISHLKVKNPPIKFAPSFVLLILNLYVAYASYIDLGKRLY